MKLQVPKNIAEIIPYPPGKPMDELEREYGVTNAIKLASNENPWGPSPKAVEAVRDQLVNLHRYPDGSNYYLAQALSHWTTADPEEIVLGNGSNEVIEFLVKALVSPGDEVITSHPSFLMYQKFVQVRGGKNLVLDLKGMHHDLDAIIEHVTPKTRLIFIDNPNNPTGTFIGKAAFDDFVRKLPETVVVVLDEAYVDFVDKDQQIDIFSYIRNSEGLPGLVSMRTFSKAFGLAGLRVGFGLMHRDLADMLHRVRQPFNINLLGQIGAMAALNDTDHYEYTLRETEKGLQWLSEQVAELGCKPYPSHTNFFLIDVKGDATNLYEAMLHKGVIVRSMKAYGYPQFIRITVGTAAENQRFVHALAECLKELAYV
ncbi:histidinol-phosphate transaminase [Desulfogranum japonicum]|uniref:histidinol-phosphate transaminase n=1 Tax=Desulfogranum japonicum TaxID=231447 RepID=UPI00048A4F98|nr:histidinol-phosphate transaminase [Desulfogranum japonicum]